MLYNKSRIHHCYIHQKVKKSLEMVDDGSLCLFQLFQFDLSCDQIAFLIIKFFVAIPSNVTQYWGVKFFAILN